MPRRLSLDGNGDLTFTEKVRDPDGDNVTHPLPGVVQLDKIDGQKVTGAAREPAWLKASVNELGVDANGDWVETVDVKILDADSNLNVAKYTFLLRADDGLEQSDREVTLEVT